MWYCASFAKSSGVSSDFERIIFCFCYHTSLFVTQSINFAVPNTIPLEKRGIYPRLPVKKAQAWTLEHELLFSVAQSSGFAEARKLANDTPSN